ncbi:hypothetical protein Slin14017_G097250 [Septoria linicola]|nr:hypothetical protein Slin14017_G097250 [Septoria linicola]
MADDLLGPVGGFFSSLIDPTPEQTQDISTISPTRVQRKTQTLETAAPEPTPSTSSIVTSTDIASSASTPAGTTASLTSTPSTATTIATSTASSSISSSTSSSAPQVSSTTAAATSTSSSSSVNAGAIAGGVVGGLAVIALLAFGIIWLLRRPRKSRVDRDMHHSKSYQGSVVSLVAHGKDVPESRPSTSSRWNTASIPEPKPMLPAHLTGPSIFVTDETDTKRLVFELAGSEPEQPTSELEGGQRYHAYRPKPS